jgi:predicted component of type VI protein secretion system
LEQIEQSQLQLLAALRSRILCLLADTAQQLPALIALPDTQQQQQQQHSSSSSSEAGVAAAAAATPQQPSSSSEADSAAAAAAMNAADCAVWAAAMRQLQQLLTVFVAVHHAVMSGNTFWGLGYTIDAYLTPHGRCVICACFDCYLVILCGVWVVHIESSC